MKTSLLWTFAVLVAGAILSGCITYQGSVCTVNDRLLGYC